MYLLLLLMGLSILFWADSQSCPYSQYSPQHSYCLPPNSKCKITKSGVDSNLKSEIVKIHNNYRSKVATGKESRAGGLPTASNMLEMVWDDTIAAVAQKWAEQCDYRHDCAECRKVSPEYVGQNIAYFYSWGQAVKPDWDTIMKNFYDEVAMFQKRGVNRFQMSQQTGHFTQIIWSSTYKVGCGYVEYAEGKGTRQYYVCDYAPGGNMMGAPIYEQGVPCSKCGGCGSYPGLCSL